MPSGLGHASSLCLTSPWYIAPLGDIIGLLSLDCLSEYCSGCVQADLSLLHHRPEVWGGCDAKENLHGASCK